MYYISQRLFVLKYLSQLHRFGPLTSESFSVYLLCMRPGSAPRTRRLLHVADSGFLLAWPSQGSWTTFMAFKSIPSSKGRRCRSLEDQLRSQELHCHSFYWPRWAQGPLNSRAGEHSPTSGGKELLAFLSPPQHSPSSVLWSKYICAILCPTELEQQAPRRLGSCQTHLSNLSRGAQLRALHIVFNSYGVNIA